MSQTLATTSNGLLWHGGNELREDAKDLDAAKVRVGSRLAPGVHGGGGAYSFDCLDLDASDPTDDDIKAARRVEAAVLTGSFNGRTGEVGLSVWNGRDLSDIRDADQKKVFEATPDLFEVKVPVKFSGGVVGGSGGGGNDDSAFTSPNGRFRTQFQDDGHMVTYDTYDPQWASDPVACAVWSNWMGMLRPLPW